ncbi:hypothetical protein SAMN04489842_2182 [Natronobacterium texcoconense]|uniref:Uncharacterized protein n=1 Tax=Natronobacterium texcoconense TaxID=1095778 RepID=A0A1H1FZ88_NATTX|nr:hypothetical protein SAMN04489842_2182 [Natronobacterium texcoconense]
MLGIPATSHPVQSARNQVLRQTVADKRHKPRNYSMVLQTKTRQAWSRGIHIGRMPSRTLLTRCRTSSRGTPDRLRQRVLELWLRFHEPFGEYQTGRGSVGEPGLYVSAGQFSLPDQTLNLLRLFEPQIALRRRLRTLVRLRLEHQQSVCRHQHRWCSPPDQRARRSLGLVRQSRDRQWSPVRLNVCLREGQHRSKTILHAESGRVPYIPNDASRMTSESVRKAGEILLQIRRV